MMDLSAGRPFRVPLTSRLQQTASFSPVQPCDCRSVSTKSDASSGSGTPVVAFRCDVQSMNCVMTMLFLPYSLCAQSVSKGDKGDKSKWSCSSVLLLYSRPTFYKLYRHFSFITSFGFHFDYYWFLELSHVSSL